MKNEIEQNAQNAIEQNLIEKYAIEKNRLGERLHSLRRQRGISQEELAGVVGVSRQAVSKWESRQAQPDLDKAVALAEYFQVSLDWLLLGKEEGNSINIIKDTIYDNTKTAQADAAPDKAPAGSAAPRMLVIIATALVYIGLLLAWAIWDYWQISLSVVVGAGFMILGVAGLAAAMQLAGAEERHGLAQWFWRYNIWPVAYLGIVAFFTGLSGWHRLAPVLYWELIYAAPANVVFALAAWLIICVCTYRWSKK